MGGWLGKSESRNRRYWIRRMVSLDMQYGKWHCVHSVPTSAPTTFDIKGIKLRHELLKVVGQFVCPKWTSVELQFHPFLSQRHRYAGNFNMF